MTATAGYVHVDDTIGGKTEGFQESLEIRWRHRQFEIYGRVRNSNLDSDSQENNFLLLESGISREF